MSKLKAKQRKALKSPQFGLPSERKDPIPDKIHAIEAKSRATQQFDKGNLSRKSMLAIDLAANRKLHGNRRGG